MGWAAPGLGWRGGRTTHLILLQVLFSKGKQPRRMMIGEGSGFFISADGYIVTNNQVAAHAQSVQITPMPLRHRM